MPIAPRNTRRYVKKHDVLSSLRHSIVRGEWQPGERLPNRDQLEVRFNASGVTIQKALSQLMADGFVHARRRNGTFVSQQLPHQTRYGVVFDSHRSDTERWRRFWTTLQQQLPLLETALTRELPAYYGVHHVGAPDYLRLQEDLESHRLAGLILTSHLCALPGTFLAQIDGTPKVVLHSKFDHIQLPQVALDHEVWMDRALDHVQKAGRRRIAILTHAGLQIGHGQEISMQRAFEARGLQYDPYLVQCADLGFPRTANTLVRLMMRPHQGVRPDALLITDDNLVDSALVALVAEQLAVPDDILVITHCNFPMPEPSVLNVKRLGFDASAVLSTCIRTIDQQIEKQPVERKTVVLPVFEDERGMFN